MNRYHLTIRLLSDATFGRGEGVAGLVDVEIEHDEYGFPFVGGRALKGLIQEEWQNLRFALGDQARNWHMEAQALFGKPGLLLKDASSMLIGAARLPHDLVNAVRSQETPREQVLASLTTIRRQTAIDAESGAPEQGSLRAFRVLLRETPLIAELDFETAPSDRTLALLAACVLSVRRGGSVRNRGRGRLQLLLHNHLPADYNDAMFSQQQFAHFAREVA